MKREPIKFAELLICGHCQSENVIVKQVGHFCSALLLICFDCQRATNFRGPEVIWTQELQKLPVRTRFKEPPF